MNEIPLHIVLLFVVVSCASTKSDTEVFEYNGKNYRVSDLPEKSKVEIFKLEKDHYDQMLEKTRAAALDVYIQEQAKLAKKSANDIEKNLLAVNPKPSEEELKKYYESMKSQLPYPYDSIKDELSAMYVEEQTEKKRNDLLKKIEKEKHVKLLLSAPVAPKFNIATTDYPRKGAKRAKVQLIEYADFTCPHCQRAVSDVNAILKKYPDQVEFVFKYYPLNKHEQAKSLARGGHCALGQNKFWEFHEYVYANQIKAMWESPRSIATKLGLNVEKFDACLKSPDSLKIVQSSYDEGTSIGVKATPTFFINGQQSLSENSVEGLSRQIEDQL